MRPKQIKELGIQLLLPDLEELRYPARLGVKGSPGIGKTEIMKGVVKELAEKTDKPWQLLMKHSVTEDPTDNKGMPALIRHEAGRVEAEFVPFGQLRQIIETDIDTVVFHDDVGQGSDATNASQMQILWGGKINEHTISSKVRHVMATNRRQDRAGVKGIIAPFLDRFVTVVEMTFDEDDWAEWALRNKIPTDLIAFVKFKPQLVAEAQPSRDIEKVPTPRSCEALGRIVNMNIGAREVWAGTVGEGFAGEYAAFRDIWHSLPSKDAIIKDPMGVPVPAKNRPDVLYALAASLAYSVTTRTMTPIVKYLNRMPDEYSVLCMKDMMLREEAKKLQETKAYTEWVMEHKDAFGLK